MGYTKLCLITTVAAVTLWGLPHTSFACSVAASAMDVTDSAGHRIVVLEGEEGVNVLKKKTAVRPIVEVRDKNNLPVAGVAVLFLLPGHGPSASFEGGKREFTVHTDLTGRASSPALKPIGKGSFRIQVRATYEGRTLSTSISQTNFKTVAQALSAGKTPGSSVNASAHSAANNTMEASSEAASSSSSAAAAPLSAAAGSATGMSGAAIAGIVGGVAAAGAGAGLALTHAQSESKQDCSSLLDQTLSDLNSESSICSSPNTSYAQCQSAAQQVLNDVGRACACSSTVFPADVRSEFIQLAQYTGLTLPSACGF